VQQEGVVKVPTGTMRRGARDVEGGDAPAFGHNFDDDDDKKKKGPGAQGIMAALPFAGGGMGASTALLRVNIPDDAHFFLNLRDKLLVASGVGFVALWFLLGFYVGFVFLVCLASLAYAADLTAYIMACDVGTPEMNVIADAIREGSEGFLRTQYGTIGNAHSPYASFFLLLAHSVSQLPTNSLSCLQGAGVGSLRRVFSLSIWFGQWEAISTCPVLHLPS